MSHCSGGRQPSLRYSRPAAHGSPRPRLLRGAAHRRGTAWRGASASPELPSHARAQPTADPLRRRSRDLHRPPRSRANPGRPPQHTEGCPSGGLCGGLRHRARRLRRRVRGLDNVATVLRELPLDAERLRAVAESCPLFWVQRLGYLLELVERSTLAEVLLPRVHAQARAPAPLVRAAATAGAPRNQRWRLILNTEVEPDL